ncbi:DNA-3-methyladenine glycosylase [Haloferula chungangensis]|uniref:Putative 3-methyladenine DNA glycosylase n=1 Tax=Haloferula chungangensis TaxID=1048331 RepID=A0ABW2L4U3_9BACT
MSRNAIKPAADGSDRRCAEGPTMMPVEKSPSRRSSGHAMETLGSAFFHRSPVEVARELLGARLEHAGCSGMIVETEAYSAVDDEACHTFFRAKARRFVDEHPPGAAYIYLNYGMYWLANVLVRSPAGESGFVLIRALEPELGVSEMMIRRKKEKDLCAGPGKLTIAMNIDGSHHGGNFLGDPFSLYPRATIPPIITGPRIGISKAADKPWRFGIKGSRYLSRRF